MKNPETIKNADLEQEKHPAFINFTAAELAYKDAFIAWLGDRECTTERLREWWRLNPDKLLRKGAL